MRRRGFLLLLAGGEEDGLAYTLRKYVTENGKVRYAALKADLGPLSRYVERLKTFDPETLPTREAKLAHWINVYNALILWSFAQKVTNLRNAFERAAYFYRRKFVVAGRERTLADIEDNSLRKAFQEPRIHFAIVCASESCPWLSREVYTGANVMAKLEADAQRYLNSDRNVRIDAAKKTVTTSEIFKWFREDFGGSEQAVLAFIGRYVKKARLTEPGWKLRYFDYNWSLNNAVE
jgi:hypothetical protein